MPLHNVQCSVCGKFTRDFALMMWPTEDPDCPDCLLGKLVIQWEYRNRLTSVHPKERAVVWFNPSTGEHRTPGKNDEPIPQRYAEQGYERMEFEHLRDLDKWCKEHNLVNEAANYDRNGRAERDLA